MSNDKYINPDDFYVNELDSWKSYWVYDLSLFENVNNLVKGAVVLPNPSHYPIVTSYILMPSKWAKVAGIMFSFGDPGSGKSTIANLANVIHGLKYTFSPTDTFASIRNSLDTMRWLDREEKRFEREGAILCWDNLHLETLKRDEKIYQLLLFGYSRATDKIQIAGNDGNNREFHVFCPKIISSVEPIHLEPLFPELRRRLFVIPHKRWQDFTASERKHYEGLDINTDRIDLDAVSWKGIENNFFEFWNTEVNYKSYVVWRSLFTNKSRKNFKIPPNLTGEKWTISIDLMTTGLTVGAWFEPQDAINDISQYWENSDNFIYGEFNATLEHLKNFIIAETALVDEMNSKLVAEGHKPYPVVINAKKLKDRLAYLQAEGSLDITPKQKDINDLMWTLGYKLTTKGWKRRI